MYLLLHGVVNVAIVVALLIGSKRVYPWAMAALAAFVLFQIYELVTKPSVGGRRAHRPGRVHQLAHLARMAPGAGATQHLARNRGLGLPTLTATSRPSLTAATQNPTLTTPDSDNHVRLKPHDRAGSPHSQHHLGGLCRQRAIWWGDPLPEGLVPIPPGRPG